MTWSHSRIKAFCDCPYRFFLKYIKEYPDEEKFYASYGKFMHLLLADFYHGNADTLRLTERFLVNFTDEVRGARPHIPSITERYVKDGSEYLRTLKPFPYRTVAVEQELRFDIEGYPFVGILDFLGEEDGEFVIVDHKSSDLKPLTQEHNKSPTKSDLATISYLRQLYLYAEAVFQAYGKYPSKLCLNCFRTGIFIEHMFDQTESEQAKAWAVDTISDIFHTDTFLPKQDFFSCCYICAQSRYCEYDIEAREERRHK